MERVANQLERIFGKSQNHLITELLMRQAEIASACAETLRKSEGNSLPDIVAFEREGDMTEHRVHEILDSAFILRFDKSDVATLASTLDNVLDGMRHIATHTDTYKMYLSPIRPEAIELLEMIETMTATVFQLSRLLNESRTPLSRVKEYTRHLIKCEAEADAILHRAEKGLVNDNKDAANALVFLAHRDLVRMLEDVTDTTNYCGTLILSIARKEA